MTAIRRQRTCTYLHGYTQAYKYAPALQNVYTPVLLRVRTPAPANNLVHMLVCMGYEHVYRDLHV